MRQTDSALLQSEVIMDVIPAIDLRTGKCVRLIQGQYHRQITYKDDPVEQAKLFQAEGAKWLHIIDLDGAKVGKPINTEAIKAITSAVDMKIQVGGGIRHEDSISRMLDMGIEPYLAASSIEAILAQRLVRVICPNCKESYKPDIEVITAIKSLARLKELPVVYHGRGCSKCRFTGYQGRTAIAELLLLTEIIREKTITRRHASEIDAQAQKEGMTSLFYAGVDKVHKGITTYEEVLKATTGTITVE